MVPGSPGGTGEKDTRMRLLQGQLQKLKLSDSVSDAISRGYERLPGLVVDECLSGDERLIVESALATFLRGGPVTTEVLTMPRRNSFGPRPVAVTSTEARAMLKALVEYLRPSLGLSARLKTGWKDAWQKHEKFGAGAHSESYLIEVDIASCYEYIDHKLLVEELILQTSEVAYANSVGELLGEIMGRSTGLPQFLSASDVLADVYMALMERALLREGASVSRFADDFKFVEATWSAARERIEQAADIARSLNLTLSTEKTRVAKVATIARRKAEREAALNDFSEAARESLAGELSFGMYEFEVDVEDVEEDEATMLAMQTLLQAWLKEEKDDNGVRKESTLSYYVPTALRRLTELKGKVLDDEVLSEIAFWKPLYIELIARYLRSRGPRKKNLQVLERIIASERQTPWACLWLLSLAESVVPAGEDHGQIENWARTLMSRDQEVVQAQACWYLAYRGRLDIARTTELFTSSTQLARPAFAAALGRQGLADDDRVAPAILGDSPRTAAAFRAGRTAHRHTADD